MRNLVRIASPELRCRGSLDSVKDSERRGLRPIGATTREAAALTERILSELVEDPCVYIFQGVRPAGVDSPSTPHVISAGRRVVLVESVTWPAGRYGIEEAGRIFCDGIYTGQSVGSLIDVISRWRDVLPADHRVMALVVVHPQGVGPVALPCRTSGDVRWALPDRVIPDLWTMLSSRGRPSLQAVIDVLAAATEAR